MQPPTQMATAPGCWASDGCGALQTLPGKKATVFSSLVAAPNKEKEEETNRERKCQGYPRTGLVRVVIPEQVLDVERDGDVVNLARSDVDVGEQPLLEVLDRDIDVGAVRGHPERNGDATDPPRAAGEPTTNVQSK